MHDVTNALSHDGDLEAQASVEYVELLWNSRVLFGRHSTN